MATEIEKFNAAVRSASLLDESLGKISAATVGKLVAYPATFYRRPQLFTSAKRSVTIPANTDVKIGSTVYTSTAAATLSISSFGDVAGGDFYIYACVPTSGTAPTFVISQNSTVPTGYTAATSRKIGGFHTLCANAGTLTYVNSLTGATVAHPLSGYVKGDILPLSCWDLWHRPKGDPEGMVYLGDMGHDVWVSIYILSWNGTKLVSVFNGVIADGYTTKKWHGELFSEALNMQNMRLPRRDEFVWAARGSNECTAIKGAADPGTTGGHVDTSSRRILSRIGCEDCCGVQLHWGQEISFANGTAYSNSFYESTVDPRSYGGSYGVVYSARLGSYWVDGAGCGSRECTVNSTRVKTYGGVCARGVSDPLRKNALKSTGFRLGARYGN